MQARVVLRGIITAGIATILLHSYVQAEEISVFNVTGVEGDVGIQYQSDEQLEGTVGETKSRNALTTTEEEISFLTHSYVYHPKFLNIDLGAGFVHAKNEVESPTGNSEYNDDLYSLSAYLRFLEGKPYPFTLYYDKTTPSVSASQNEKFILENEKYGINASLNEPVLPFSVNVDAFRQTQKGYGTTQVVNNTTEQVNWRAYRSFGETGYGQFTYYTNNYESENGLIGQTIEKRESNSQSTSLDMSYRFGAQRQVAFTGLISHYTEEGALQREDYRFNSNISWQHSEQTLSFYRFDYFSSEVEHTESISKSAALGASSDISETIAVNGELQADETETTGLVNRSNAMRGTVSYTRPFSVGKFGFSAGGGYNQTQREANVNEINRKGESIRLDGLQKVALGFPNVLAVTRVIHANPDRQHIILIEGVDYEIELPAGNVGPAYIRRLGTINLESGESVLVDYTYQTGGSVVYEALNQHYHAQLDLYKYYTLYAGYSETETKIKEGSPTIPISSVSYTRTGARMDVPFFQDDLIVGAEAQREEKDDDISPYVRNDYTSYVQARFWGNAQLRVSAQHSIQDNEYTTEDVDLRKQTARFTIHPWARSVLSFELSNEKDTGSSIPRRIKTKAVVGQWRLRKLVLTIDGRSIVETQGSYERQHNTIMAGLKREF